MDAAAEFAFAKDRVNTAMLLNQAEVGELSCGNTGIEVHVVIASNLGHGAGDAAFNACFHFFGSWHQKRG